MFIDEIKKGHVNNFYYSGSIIKKYMKLFEQLKLIYMKTKKRNSAGLYSAEIRNLVLIKTD